MQKRGSTSFMRVQNHIRKNFVKVAEIIGEDARTFAQMLDTKPVEAFNFGGRTNSKDRENSGNSIGGSSWRYGYPFTVCYGSIQRMG